MILPSSLSTALLASPILFAREDVVSTVVTTAVKEFTSYIVVDGQTEETVVMGSPTVVAVGGTITTLKFPPTGTHTQADETTISVEIDAQPLGSDNFEFAGKFNGDTITRTAPFTTTWTYPGTTMELGFLPRPTSFLFTGRATSEITIPPEHTHITIDGIETAVDLPGITTTMSVTASINAIVYLRGTTTTMKLDPETFGFTVHQDTIGGGDNLRFCGTETVQTFSDPSLAEIGGKCVAGTTYAVVFPLRYHDLYLNDPGTTKGFVLPGYTTTYIQKQTVTIVKEASTIETIIPAEVSTYVTTISDTNVFCGEPSTVQLSSEVALSGPFFEPKTSDFSLGLGDFTSESATDSTSLPVSHVAPGPDSQYSTLDYPGVSGIF